MIRLIVGVPLVLVVLAIVLYVVTTLALILTYSTMNDEETVATIQFESVPESENVYMADLSDEKGSKIGDYKIFGDQWRIDAGFVKMKSWANIFGLDSRYALNRFEGRYENIDDQNTSENISYQIDGNEMVERWSFFVDTSYGSSTYKDIKLDTKYTVLKSHTGLLVREAQVEEKKEKSYFEKAKSLFSR